MLFGSLGLVEFMNTGTEETLNSSACPESNLDEVFVVLDSILILYFIPSIWHSVTVNQKCGNPENKIAPKTEY